MKNNIRLSKILVALSLFVLISACDDEEGEPALSVDFAGLSTSYMEEDGTATITLPLRNAGGQVSKLNVEFAGTATEGEDFELVGITEEGVQLSIIDDAKFEENETIRVQLISSDLDLNGNTIHTVTIKSNCADTDDLNDFYFVASFDASEIYAPDDIYGPYAIALEQDETDPNKYWMDNFWDSGLPAYLVYDPSTKSISFPEQIPAPAFPTRIITSEPTTITDNCNFAITTSYRGYTWDYEFVRQ